MTAQLRWPSTNQNTAWRTFLVVGDMREEYPGRGRGQEQLSWRRAIRPQNVRTGGKVQPKTQAQKPSLDSIRTKAPFAAVCFCLWRTEAIGRKEPSMIIIGCDYHPSWQQICWIDTLTGETGERKLEHAQGEAEKYYRSLPSAALIGMESTGNCEWFTELMASLDSIRTKAPFAAVCFCLWRTEAIGRKEPSMIIIGCDYHPSWQQICWIDTLTGETGERKLEHAQGEAEKYYRSLPSAALIGMESTGNCQWF